ncbi:DUF4388 domain-containing protein [Thermogemmatispora tikiterensis]|uniref:DUF4388 domain-containing protein n=1 Tax=Thermogemmatispora tikiterensis TaxID=1825093 RepID=A0A328VDK2_9CHLR|nr:DUF4388 domain-containing protein [Thermogemmatispora tikiterensis]RAQ95766.1 hypothetical protein A4R35_09485 [Thermogemmatispora tikiterensis]
MYTKDFASLLQLLSLSQQSGTLIVLRQGEAWQASLQLQKGRPLSCIIISLVDGRLLMSGAQAVDWLASRGELQWYLTVGEQAGAASLAPTTTAPTGDPGQRSAPSPSPSQGMRPSHLVPRRLLQSPPLSSWSREERLLFALIDGSRTVSEIAHLLRRSPEQIMPLLLSLIQRGAITLEELHQ